MENSDKLSIKGKAPTGPVGLFGQYVIRGVVGSKTGGGVRAVMCGRSVGVDDDSIGVIVCLSDAWLEVILDPLLDSIFVGFLGVVKVNMDVIFE